MYSKKQAKALKALAKEEADPVRFLAPEKVNENADLKRKMEVRQVGQNLKNQKAILALLKQKVQV